MILFLNRCPVKELTTQKLIESIEVLRNPETISKAKELGEKMMLENGVERGAESFYRNLPLETMICDVSIFDNQSSRLAKHYCLTCRLKMCEEVDEVIHRPLGGRSDHQRIPYRTKVWGKITKGHKASSENGILMKQHSLSSLRSTVNRVIRRISLKRDVKRDPNSASVTSPNISPRTAEDLDEIPHEEFVIEQAYSRAISFLSFWDRLDVDGNSLVDEQELTAFFSSQEDAKTIIALVDMTGDHTLSFTELAWIMAQRSYAVN
jgi:hypothetical protein